MDDLEGSSSKNASLGLWLVGIGVFCLGLFKLFKVVRWNSPLTYMSNPWHFLDNLIATLSYAVGPTLAAVGLLLWVGSLCGEGG